MHGPLLSPRRWQLVLAPVQRAVFRALVFWRDAVCRQEDESTGYVLPRAQLATLSKDMPGAAPPCAAPPPPRQNRA